MKSIQGKNNGSTIKVLHVDRDESFLFMVNEILKILGDFEIDPAYSALDAYKALERKEYDVIVYGHSLSLGKSGLDFFRELKAKGSKVPFIMFSVHAEIRDEAIEMGVAEFIDKNGDCEKVYADLTKNIKEVCKK